ncbi:A-agglutinin anchorage subunit-like [Echeneis naucrates]|uniref:A-agglutinin anchorage subunit-like n=1 Tax=Echeneis naucrates TaxID=173247 RepID=A0A665VQ82_ECHNA|nr:A-agglutinin anchorage subunit-like [Echeneis naucrates]
MELKGKLLFVPVVMVMVTASTLTTATPKTTTTTTTTTPRTTTTAQKTTTTTPRTTTTTPRTTTTARKTTTTTPRTTTTTPRTTTTARKTTTTTPRTTTTTPRTTTTTPRTTTTTSWTTSWTTYPWTTGRPTVNLNGKMFTLSNEGGGVSLYPPYYSPSTHDYSTSSAPSWTTAPPTRGLSVCLRYLAEDGLTLFTLSPGSSRRLSLSTSGSRFVLDYDYYASVSFQPNISLLPSVAPDLWRRVCVVIDSQRSVAQVFSGSYGSIRKILQRQYSWTGEPVMDISGFDGQVTDVQVWDYNLQYNEVFNYMNGGVYRLYSGSVLSWSYISYSLRGKMVLEDVYEIQAKKDRSRKRGHNKTRRVFNRWQNEISEKQRL